MTWKHGEVNTYLQEHKHIKSIDKLIDKRRQNTHHGLEQSNGGNSNPKNLVITDIKLHDNYNCVFLNMNIREKIIFLLELHGKGISEEFKHNIYKLLKETDPNFYFQKDVIGNEDKAKCTLEKINQQKKKIMHIVG